ncbi:hypothetical protein [Desertivirga brevis]|uniref:hypothetical protein n=1 Tax=Desertivirga brevis TaxID=2810310 RepID=UPI001A95DD3B|nr:hypothetical protein [Pedobacter sp. SYSU D00873]
MKKFLTQILLFSSVFFLFDKLFYAFLLVSPSMEKDKRLELVLNGKMNKDIVVLGSSRGARNIIASQIGDSLNVSSYNLSYPGSNIEFHEFLLRSLITHNKKPKLVLLALDDPYELLPNESITFRLDRLYPLAKYKYINDEMIKRGEKNFLSKFFILSRINKKNFDIRRKSFTTLDTLMHCGSMPISFQRKNRQFTFQNDVQKYEKESELPEKIRAFDRLQDLCLHNNIKLYLVYSPNFKNHNSRFETRIQKLSHPAVSYIRYDTKNSIYLNKDYFYDQSHLKKNGAIIFTDEIIKHLKGEVRLPKTLLDKELRKSGRPIVTRNMLRGTLGCMNRTVFQDLRTYNSDTGFGLLDYFLAEDQTFLPEKFFYVSSFPFH